MPPRIPSGPVESVRIRILEWLDQNYHFGEARRLVENDRLSLTDRGILDRAALGRLFAYLEDSFRVTIDRRRVEGHNLDTLENIVAQVVRRLDSQDAGGHCNTATAAP
jgi:hypothetical protein